MIIHIFPQEKFTVPFIKFINENFHNKDHVFLVYGRHNAYDEKTVEKFNNIKYILDKSDKKTFIKYIKEGDKIILHSLYLFKWMFLYLLINIKISKKCSWVIWGSDLYSHRLKKIRLKNMLLELVKRSLAKRFEYIITLSKNDYKLAKDWYKVKGEYREGIYINPIKLKYLENIKTSKERNNKKINIQIGNSADEDNMHLEILDILSKYKDENIMIYVPLSYGSKKYALEVKEYGERKFKDKFVAMLDFLDKNEYGKFLGEIDIAIFNNNRQQALGNIRALAYLGTKIYMRNDTTMWTDFISDGYKLNTIKELENETFNEFIFNDNGKIVSNSNLSKSTFDEKEIACKWQKIFNY